MQQGSIWHRWACEPLGAAMAVGSVGYLWVACLTYSALADFISLLAVASLMSLILIQDERRKIARLAATAIPIAAMIAAVCAFWLPQPYSWDVQVRSITTFFVSLTLTRWRVSGSQSTRSGRILRAAACGGLAGLVAGGHVFSLPGVASVSVFLLGAGLYLWDRSGIQGDTPAPDWRGGGVFPAVTGATFIAAILIAISPPLLASVGGRAASVGAKGLQQLLLLLLRPIGYLVGLIITGLQRFIVYRNKENPTQNGLPSSGLDDLLKNIKEGPTPLAVELIGYLALAALIFLAAWLIWRSLETPGHNGQKSGTAESQTVEATQSIFEWAASKSKRFASLAKSVLRKQAPADPIVRLYSRFLVLARQAGYPKEPGLTPLEFAAALAKEVPQAASPVSSISSTFCRCFYGGRRLAPQELANLEDELRAFRDALQRVSG